VNPDAVVEARTEFYSPQSSARLLCPEPDVVIDAIDNIAAKLHLIATCVRERIRLVTSMGAAARTDPTRVRAADLGETRRDPFAREVRKLLRKKYDLDCTRPIGVTAVYSDEPPVAPVSLAYDEGAFKCVCPGGENGLNDCEHQNRIDGSTPFVPSVFGMTAAAQAVRLLLNLV